MRRKKIRHENYKCMKEQKKDKDQKKEKEFFLLAKFN